MIDPTRPQSPPASGAGVRFEATLHRGERQAQLKEIPTLDLDRLPSPPDEVRVLITIDDAARLVQRGFEVRLLRAHTIRPLDRSRTTDDDAVRQWLEQRVKDVERRGEL